LTISHFNGLLGARKKMMMMVSTQTRLGAASATVRHSKGRSIRWTPGNVEDFF